MLAKLDTKVCISLSDTDTLKFMFSKKATKFDKIFAVDLTLCSKRQIDGGECVNFCGLLGKYELYDTIFILTKSLNSLL